MLYTSIHSHWKLAFSASNSVSFSPMLPKQASESSFFNRETGVQDSLADTMLDAARCEIAREARDFFLCFAGVRKDAQRLAGSAKPGKPVSMFDRKTVQNFKMASILSGSIFQLHCMHTLAYFEQ